MDTQQSWAIKQGSALHQEMISWRRDIHRHPETAYEEVRTSERVAQLLTSFGLEVTCGLGRTGVVAVLQGEQGGDEMIALRADMDALDLCELNEFEHRSCRDGKMHACGHDGHTAMLLGAAKYLAENPAFAGKVCFIFQPAEEGKAGARAMIRDGLFERFPATQVFGMHNWPGLAAGAFAVHSGAVMASTDSFDIVIEGQGGHAAMPHLGVDPVVVAAQVIIALQTAVSRQTDPLKSAVLSVTTMRGGEAYNVIPESVTLTGTCRSFCPEVKHQLERLIQKQAHHICEAFGAKATVTYRAGYPATVNTAKEATVAETACLSLVSPDQVLTDMPSSMGAEDFAFMLQERPGAYIWIGNGDQEGFRGLHNPYYDFNDDVLALGASYWVALIDQLLSR
ncbi:M20 aminoacylase family protein [Neptunomonas sp. XY-337]|uniref:M20 aminoacylase family protein n=1 Tax=Neptunomonas sp. XY-337 TaxID=2561897 RepID=UPI0010AB4209|nr:M20 aminoacylase family protein [Neptunomonas sp. XY-337]